VTERSTYVSNILVRIPTLSRHHNNRSPNIRRLNPLSIATKGVVVDEREMVIGTRRVADFEVGNLRATPLGQRSRNVVSSILLRHDGGAEQRERAESRERHRKRETGK
jgi:hypothetical protein